MAHADVMHFHCSSAWYCHLECESPFYPQKWKTRLGEACSRRCGVMWLRE